MSGPNLRTQLWEECPRCGEEPIYLETGLCSDCSPGSGCRADYDRTEPSRNGRPYSKGIGLGHGPVEDDDP